MSEQELKLLREEFATALRTAVNHKEGNGKSLTAIVTTLVITIVFAFYVSGARTDATSAIRGNYETNVKVARVEQTVTDFKGQIQSLRDLVIEKFTEVKQDFKELRDKRR